MTSKQIVDVRLVEHQIVVGMVEDLLPVLRTDVNQSIAMGKGERSGGGGYLNTLDGAGLLDWKTAPTKTSRHVTAEGGSLQSTLPGTFKE